MATKKIKDIMKEIEEQIKKNKEREDDISKLLEEAAEAEDSIKGLVEFGENWMYYTVDNINEVMPWLSIASLSAPELAPGLASVTAIVSAIKAPFDYASDRIEQENKISELAQDIYDYIADYNEKIKAAEEKIELADKNAEDARNSWKEIQNLVDKNGRIKDPQKEDTVILAALQMEDYNDNIKIEIIGDRIQDYPNLIGSVNNIIDEQNIKEKKEILRDIYDEAYLNSDKVKSQIEKLKEADTNATDFYNIIKDVRIKTEHGQPPEGYGGYSPVAILSVEKLAEKIMGDTYDNYAALINLDNYYDDAIKLHDDLLVEESELKKAIARTEYESEYRDAEKPLAQLDGEAYDKRLKESKQNNSSNKPLYETILEKYKAEPAVKPDQQPPADVIIIEKEPYSNEQPVSDTVQNNIYTQETTELTNNIIDDYIEQLRTLPEEMRDIGQQSRDAFIEGLLDGDDEHFGERIAEATLKIANMFSDNMENSFYQSGGESAIKFIEGFEDELERSYERIMAERSLEVSGMTAMASFNYYGGTSLQSRRKPEAIELKNHEEITVKVDREVLGKTMREYTRLYERSTGT